MSRNDDRAYYEPDPVVRSQDGTGATFESVLAGRLTRRGLLRAGLLAGVAASPLARALSPSGEAPFDDGLDFEAITPTTPDRIIVPEGYRAQVLIRWGDPIVAGGPAFAADAQSPEAQRKQFGYNNDFVGFLPLPFGSNSSRRGLLAVNHEYTNPELMFPVEKPTDMDERQTRICMEAEGFAVVEIEMTAEGYWNVVRSSPHNVRYSATTEFEITGPARGHRRLRTKRDPEGKTAIGTFANCAAGKTPWGTVLSAEENFQDYYAHAEAVTDPRERRSHERYGISKKASEYGWERFREDLDLRREAHGPYMHGWVVEFDPYDPTWKPKKRTALGRFRHEAATTHVSKGNRVVMYSGDDARFEYVYKFVCARPFRPGDREANRDLVDEGTLYVARFREDGTGEWLPLVHGVGPLTRENGFEDQGDVVIDARLAADLLGATKMDRPEDIEVNPVNQKVYLVCTNNRDRGKEGKASPDKMNPRAENKHGHIIEITEEGDDHAATRFRWEMFIVCGDPSDETTYFAGYDRTKVSPISCPDNIAFDGRGNLWIATDGQPSALKRNDGFYAVPVQGTDRGRLRQFMSSVPAAEVCGPEFTPDGTTLFLAIQHPGEGSKYGAFSTSWPDGEGPPRPSVIAIRAEDGRPIGTREKKRTRRALLGIE
jgi:secreted PhoX family phosphatase